MYIQVKLNYDTIIDLLGFSFALILGLYFLFFKSITNNSNLFFSLFLWSLSIEIMNSLLEVFPNFSPILSGSFFTITFLYLYLISRFDHPSFKWFGILLLPGIIQNIWPISINGTHLMENTLNILLLILGVLYMKTYQKKLEDNISKSDNNVLNWLEKIFYSFITIHFLCLIQDIMSYSQWSNWMIKIERISDLSMLLLIIWMGYTIFYRSELFHYILPEIIVEENNETLNEVRKVQLKEDSPKDREIFDTIRKRLIEERFFIDPKLSVRSLSEHIGINEKELSRLINKYTEENFYHFINQYRIEEFKILIDLKEKQHLSILGLAEEAGFNSKSTFYAVFKAFEGTTPKQYVLSVKESK